ncbi:hypothetical protein AJ87_12795 [Rhizobium yanglingense]|nr:hypothetical protein AJ87_12795 [Rhizobium yanglingense]
MLKKEKAEASAPRQICEKGDLSGRWCHRRRGDGLFTDTPYRSLFEPPDRYFAQLRVRSSTEAHIHRYRA